MESGQHPCKRSLGASGQRSAAVAREGILIGHPDTGYTKHVENWSNNPTQRRLLPQFGWDFWKNDADATDDLDSELGSIFSAGSIGNPGHGTGTSSIIFSDEGPRSKPQYVSGVAPRARLIPYRVAPSVVIWDRARLADAIIRATDAGCHVISISMGGLPLDYLERAVHHAVSNGVIVCCAAGNIFGANDVLHGVVWPAHYPEALAVAASNANDQPWSGSSRAGPEVDITAPGESVWHAIAKKGKPLTEVARGDGTSFAVATTAGVAALWLAYHDRERLISLYGRGTRLRNLQAHRHDVWLSGNLKLEYEFIWTGNHRCIASAASAAAGNSGSCFQSTPATSGKVRSNRQPL